MIISSLDYYKTIFINFKKTLKQVNFLREEPLPSLDSEDIIGPF